LFEDATSRSEVVCTFLALLELIRLKQLVCAQSADFAEIEIRRATTFSGAIPASTDEPVAAVPAPENESTPQS
jgi:chromatin segregation and condensation protein Rec8/ScpA/Scc1 (kleisin family)